MKIVDLNVLLYAINRSAKHHEKARSCWEAALGRDEPVGLAWNVILGFLRLSTRPSIFPRPLDAGQACERVERWLARPNVRIVREADEHMRLLRGLLAETGAAGNLTSDAHLAALALSHGATLVSFDNDFARFPRLQWINPLTDKELSHDP